MSKESIRQQFGANAESYATSTVHAQGSSLVRLVELVKPLPHWHVLDIATGAGHTALAFAPHVAEVVATDITPQMLDQTRKLAGERGLSNVIVETADSESLPYSDNSFDLVTCRIAPHHFADIPKFVAESARVLRPDGIFAVVDNVVPSGPAGDYINAFEKLRDPSHGRCLPIEEWIEVAANSGLEQQQYEVLTKTMEFEFWAQRHDPFMQRCLLSMLTECSGPAAEFLQPTISDDGTHFQLREGLFIWK